MKLSEFFEDDMIPNGSNTLNQESNDMSINIQNKLTA